LAVIPTGTLLVPEEGSKYCIDDKEFLGNRK
jgi:hypothetical protein